MTKIDTCMGLSISIQALSAQANLVWHRGKVTGMRCMK
jgi:hypothetical protein